jgi:hypothetical protein
MGGSALPSRQLDPRTMATGQLRAPARRAVLVAHPAAAARHREKAEKEARVEVWSEPSSTAALAGRDCGPPM